MFVKRAFEPVISFTTIRLPEIVAEPDTSNFTPGFVVPIPILLLETIVRASPAPEPLILNLPASLSAAISCHLMIAVSSWNLRVGLNAFVRDLIVTIASLSFSNKAAPET